MQPLQVMRDGFILLHRKAISKESWKNPRRSYAWIDLLLLAAFEQYTAHDGVVIRRGEIVASYRFLADKWNEPLSTVYRWIQYFIAEHMMERSPERCMERDAERFFIVNYAKYQEGAERDMERTPEQEPERTPEQIKENINNKSVKTNSNKSNADSDESASDRETIKKLFDYYEKLSGRKVLVRDKRTAKIRGLLKKFEPRDIALAWQLMAKSAFLRGEDEKNTEGKDYFTIDYALRYQKVEEYLISAKKQLQGKQEQKSDVELPEEKIIRPGDEQ